MRTWPVLLLAACGGRPTAEAPAADDAAACLRFTAAPSAVAPPGPVATIDPVVVPGAEGGWVLAWRDALSHGLRLRRLDPTLFPVGPEEPIAAATNGDVHLVPDAGGVLVTWYEGVVLRAFRRDAALGVAAPPVAFHVVDRPDAPAAADGPAAVAGTALDLVWHGATARPPFTVWDVDDKRAVPTTLPGLDEATATGPGVLAAADGPFLAVWPQRSGEGAPWTLRVADVGGEKATDLATLPDAPALLDAAVGDGLLAAWIVDGAGHVQRAGPSGAAIGDPVALGPVRGLALAAAGPHELVATTGDALRLLRLDRPACAPVDPTAGLGHPGRVDVALAPGGRGVVVWEGDGPSGTRVLWGRPFEVVDPAPAAP